MENYLMLNGKRIDLTEEQVKTLTAEEKKNPFERVETSGEYFFIKASGIISKMNEDNIFTDDRLFSVANYCTDRAMIGQRALHETLNRLLWRYSEEHGGDGEWNGVDKHWVITRVSENITVDCTNRFKVNGAVYFKNHEVAISAIDEIVKPFMAEHPEFVW